MSVYTLMWLWFWFLFGSTVYIVKRGFYLINGPNPVANNLKQFFHVAGVPLLFRVVVDSMIYWAMFTPQIAQAGLEYLGFQKFAGIIAVITKFAVCSLGFGLIVDSLVDWGIGTVLSKIPFLKEFWPQMPESSSKVPSRQSSNASGATGESTVMKWIEFHVFGSGFRTSLNSEQVSQVSDLEGHAGILRSDGGVVEVQETYEHVISKLKGDL